MFCAASQTGIAAHSRKTRVTLRSHKRNEPGFAPLKSAVRQVVFWSGYGKPWQKIKKHETRFAEMITLPIAHFFWHCCFWFFPIMFKKGIGKGYDKNRENKQMFFCCRFIMKKTVKKAEFGVLGYTAGPASRAVTRI